MSNSLQKCGKSAKQMEQRKNQWFGAQMSMT